MATCKLGVEVVSAHDLKRQDGQGISPYVVLKFNRQRFCTATKENDLNPVWNKRFYFDVSDPSNLPELFLKATIYHRERSTNDWRGTTMIRGPSFKPLPDAVVLSYPLEKLGKSARITGELRLKVYITDEASIRASDPLPATGSGICSSGFDDSKILESILRGESSPHRIPFQCLKEITNNFSDEQVLGQGGFGVVYKGVLHDGKMIAVKRIAPSLRPGLEKQFENEVCHLMKLKHPNIVRFVGYCYQTWHECLEYNGKHVLAETAERLLCLEYLPKGSLDNYLSDESPGLDWRTRYNIIEGICYGLCNLHENFDKPIIHLDLKPANILLDDNMLPKVTDFGLSRLLDEQTICTASRPGTLGYMAPELINSGKLTPKSDIFSLGVIILEVVTGHRDYPAVDSKTALDEFIELEVKKWRNVLQRSPGYGSLKIDCEQIKRCLQVGLICVNPERTKRPPMTKVISMLQGSKSVDCDISIVFQQMCI
ncbi:hypothetical protein QYE76_008831 [Lolium multiflorum]|uniref:Protein kinase domain-containing protein n=1 Tax=Lolium multiflorum TaxID=4521 RepID=A0AAD8X306_LOLMU|nr:hypothetical protein QYE76_008831 [Lolium multiflorum]